MPEAEAPIIATEPTPKGMTPGMGNTTKDSIAISKTVCAECSEVIEDFRNPQGQISHGICQACFERILATLPQLPLPSLGPDETVPRGE